jgi:hypothetical protein
MVSIIRVTVWCCNGLSNAIPLYYDHRTFFSPDHVPDAARVCRSVRRRSFKASHSWEESCSLTPTQVLAAHGPGTIHLGAAAVAAADGLTTRPAGRTLDIELRTAFVPFDLASG